MSPVVPGAAGAFERRVTSRMRQLARGMPTALQSSVSVLIESPGKRLRSGLTAACASYGHADPDRVARAGALVEMLHVASLLHDDVIDRSPWRRGAPSAHTVVGAELALLAGLGCFALAGAEAADLGPGVSVAVGRTVGGLAYGQMLDVERAFDTSLGITDYLELVVRKTADLFRLCCLLGATEARLGDAQVSALCAFGTELGVAFQILDDCLDIEATDPGKPSGTDHLLGLFGAPTLLALRADASGRLGELLLAPSLHAADLPAVRTLVRELGGLNAARDLARDRMDAAMTALDRLGDQPGRGVVLAVIDPIRRRLR